MNLRNNHGAALPIVLLFSVVALIVAAIYTAGQYTTAKPTLTGPASFQAMCNARSGIWKGMELLSKGLPDTLQKIKVDSMFNNHLFGRPVSVPADSGFFLAPDDTPMTVQPFSADSFGVCALSLSYTPCFLVLASKGTFREFNKTARAFLGGLANGSPDTVCYLVSPGQVEGGIMEGKPVNIPENTTAPPRQEKAPGFLELHDKELYRLVSYYRAKLIEKTDTLLPKSPTVVQSGDKAVDLPEVVNGPLFVNGSYGPLVWREKRRVYVFGDVQISGKAEVENVEFVVAGEVKCFDEARLRNVSVFCTRRFVIGDMASFSGNALSLKSVLVYKQGRIEDKSVVVAYGDPKALPADPKKASRPQPPISEFSVFLSQNAYCDGVIVACGNPGGIKTDKNVVVNGILWASGSVAHQGALCGVLRARNLTDIASLKAGNQPAAQKNTMTGSVRRLPSVMQYYCPFFMGRRALARWEEG